MTRRTLLAAVMGLGLPAMAVAEPGDIPWFKVRPAERDTLLRRCEADVALAYTGPRKT